MFRKIISTLEKWNNQRTHKPLMVIETRQTGKTWIVKKFFDDTYKDYIYVNLEEEADIRSGFDNNLDPDTIMHGMEMVLGRKIDETVPIFFDEIQACEKAITSLKYFCEDSRDFRIITAGSMLGVKIRRFETSFSVGKVEIINMYPMDFEEFLLACGENTLKDGMPETDNKYRK